MNIFNLFGRRPKRLLPESDGRMPFPHISMKAAERLLLHGQTRTLADIAMALNEQRHFKSLDEFQTAFGGVVLAYIQRGTVSNMASRAVLGMILDNKKELMGKDGYLDFDKLVRMVDDLRYGLPDDPLNAIYNWREKTKLLRLAAVLNEIMQYTSAEDLFKDLSAITIGPRSCNDIGYLNDSFRYPLAFFRNGVDELWDEITTDGILDNKKLEARMFTDHERKVADKLLGTVLKEDFVKTDGCHPGRYFPKKPGTAPVYTIDYSYQDHCSGEFGKLTKSCGEGIGPNASDSLYEFHLVEDVLKREVKRGTYMFKDGIYYPSDVYSEKPVFHQWEGMLRFEMERDKQVFIINLNNRGRK